jgi:hypothetical protein
VGWEKNVLYGTETASYYSSADSDGFSGTIWEGFREDVFLCELCSKLWEVTALWFTLETLASFTARPQDLNQPYKWPLPGMQHNLNTEGNCYIAVSSELLLPSYLHH